MFICSCKAVTDRTVHAAVAAGASCPDQIAAMCGAGSRCGGCLPVLERILEDHAESEALVSVRSVA